ncbi:MAG: hypothetical protein WDO13_02980 [Verrucomicrobiota bacterium]
MTVLELLERTTKYFADHAVASPRLTIELMLAEMLKKTRMQLYLEFDKDVPEAVLDQLRPLVKRRGEGEPLEYVLGVTTFAATASRSRRTSLVPRPETEILLEEAIKRIDPRVCPCSTSATGSGILAVSLARKFPELEIVAVDASGRRTGRRTEERRVRR